MDTGKLSDSFHASLQRAIVDGSPNGVLVVNQDSAVVSVNERFFSVWGLPIPASPIDNLLFTPDSNQLNQVALLVEHLHHCVAHAVTAGGDEATAKLDEASAAVARLVRS